MLLLAGLATVTLTGTAASAAGGEVYDSFNGTGSVGGSVTEVGGKTWQAINGTWTRSGSGTATTTAAPGSNPMVVTDLGSADVDARMTTTGSSGETLFFRVQDATNWLRARVRHSLVPEVTTVTEYMHQDYFTDLQYTHTWREYEYNSTAVENQWQDKTWQKYYYKNTPKWSAWYFFGQSACQSSSGEVSLPSDSSTAQYRLGSSTTAGCSGGKRKWDKERRDLGYVQEGLWVDGFSSPPAGYTSTSETRFVNVGSPYWGSFHPASGSTWAHVVGSRTVVTGTYWTQSSTVSSPNVMTGRTRDLSETAWWTVDSKQSTGYSQPCAYWATLPKPTTCVLTGATRQGGPDGAPFWNTTPCVCRTRTIEVTTNVDRYDLLLGKMVNGTTSNLATWDLGGPTAGFRVTATGSTIKVYKGAGGGTLLGTVTATNFATQTRHGCGLSGDDLATPASSLTDCHLTTIDAPPPACPPVAPDQYGGTEGEFTPVDNVLILDTNKSGPIPSGTSRNVPVTLPNVDPADIDRVALCVVSDWQAAGSVVLSNPDDAEPATSTITRSEAEPTTKLVSTEVETSLEAPGTIRVSATGTPRVRILVQGWYGWRPDDVDDPPSLDEADPTWLHKEPDGASQPAPPFAADSDQSASSTAEAPTYRTDYGSLCKAAPAGSEDPAPQCSTIAPAPTAEDEGRLSGCKSRLEHAEWDTMSRSASCVRYTVQWGHMPLDTNRPYLAFEVRERIETDLHGNVLEHQWQLKHLHLGDDLASYRVRVHLRCSGCSSVPSGYQSSDWFGDADPRVSELHGANAIASIGQRQAGDNGRIQDVSTRLHFELHISSTGGGDDEFDGLESTRIRCDNLRYLNAGHGCVFPNRTATFRIVDSPASRESASLVRSALGDISTHPGRASDGFSLSRLYPKLWAPSEDNLKRRKIYRGNRREARKLCWDGYSTRPPGKSCDEYPFASTWNGCWWDRSAYPPVDPRHHYCRARFVDESHNTDVGNQLNRFFQQYRILDTGNNSEYDRYFVEVMPPD